MLEAENWAIALELYKKPSDFRFASGPSTHGNKAMSSAREKRYPGRYRRLELAIDTLYPHTDLYKVSNKLYRRRMEGTMKSNQEDQLRQLGVKM